MASFLLTVLLHSDGQGRWKTTPHPGAVLERAQPGVNRWIRKKQWTGLPFSNLLPGGRTTQATAGASEGSLHCHDCSAHSVRDPEDKGPQCPVSIPGEVVCVFSYNVHHLLQVVLNIIFIIHFKTCYH